MSLLGIAAVSLAALAMAVETYTPRSEAVRPDPRPETNTSDEATPVTLMIVLAGDEIPAMTFDDYRGPIPRIGDSMDIVGDDAPRLVSGVVSDVRWCVGRKAGPLDVLVTVNASRG